MGKVVGAISLSHAPGMTGWPDVIKQSDRDRMHAACARLSSYVEARRPDVIVAFLDDHFENLYRNLSPIFAVAVADEHVGPADYWCNVLRVGEARKIGGMQRLAAHILASTISAEFDVTRMGGVEYGNNLMVPLGLIPSANGIPVVPVFINVFQPPLPTLSRAFDFAASVRRAVESYPEDVRVLFMGTGGLSHSPPVWFEHIHGDDPTAMEPVLGKMRRYQTEGRSVLRAEPGLMDEIGAYEQVMARRSAKPVVNPEWDRAFLARLERGDVEGILRWTREEIERDGGTGGLEILNWVAVMGAMNGAPATVVDYHDVSEWITGIGYVMYEGS